MTRLSNWDGSITAENIGSMAQLRQVYGSILSMQTATGLGLTSLATINQRLDTYKDNYEIVLAATHMQYYRLKDNTLSSNLMYVNNDQLYDTPGRIGSPYQREDAVVLAPLRYQYESYNSVPFKIPYNLFIRNTTDTLQNIRIDFGNGQGYQTVSLNSIKYVTYSQSGEYTLKIRIRYTNGVNYYAQTKLFLSISSISTATNGATGPTLYDGIANMEFSRTGAPYPSSGGSEAQSSGTVSIEYGADPSGDCTLDRPLIVAEGFVINAIITGDESHEVGYRHFITGDQTGGINTYIEPNLTLREALFNRGYDIVFLNYDDASAPIQRNAHLLENVIEWVNANKDVDAEQNVVIGQSMGGPVARYALRHMEQTSRMHDTRLYVSFDGPHQGANIPLALQAGVHHLVNSTLKYGIVSIPLKDMFPQVQNLYDGVNAPAARQMLIYSLNGTGTNLTLNSAEHDAFYAELHSMGMPCQGGIRNISIANGSECGTDQGFDPYALSVELSEGLDLNYFHAALASILTLNPLRGWESLLATDTDVKANFALRMLPDHESKPIYSGSIQLKKKILLVFSSTKDLIPQGSFTTPSNILPYDNAGGGVRDFGNDLSDYIPEGLESAFQILHFNFLPTHSTLDIGSGNLNITNTEVYGAYSAAVPPSGNLASSFDNFYTNSDDNEVHLNVNPGNGRFLIAELDGGTPTCYADCTTNDLNLTISGASSVCGNTSFSIPTLPSTATINWGHSNNLQIVSGQGTRNITVNQYGSFNGSGWFSVSLDGDCGEVNLDEHAVWVGGPLAPTTNPSGVPAIATNTGANVTINITEVFGDVGGLYSINWSTNDASALGLSCNDNMCVVECLKAGYNYVYLSASNSCGQSLARQIPFDVTGGGGGGVCCPWPQIVIGPNPTTDWVDITFTNQDELEAYYGSGKMNYKVLITNMAGAEKYHGVINKNGLKINLKHANEGIYLVKVYGKDFEHTSRLRIN
jgi:hypothetical protein